MPGRSGGHPAGSFGLVGNKVWSCRQFPFVCLLPFKHQGTVVAGALTVTELNASLSSDLVVNPHDSGADRRNDWLTRKNVGSEEDLSDPDSPLAEEDARRLRIATFRLT